MNATPDVNDARIAVLESKIADLVTSDQRIEAMVIDGHRRLEVKLDRLLNDSVPTGVAKSMARMQAFAAACGTGLIAALTFIATNF